ncbi:hypothetical protein CHINAEXTREME_07250 [Halobiforma lacisalsi AJ5]|uniref:Uncharacterized protein n=1 Tax=Natronobacterium lacisalsi AJ5 TaxID=358396 RepID=M0LV70_NATLA|nr:hypothetical protein [Halobiforma lacisalsi]APW97582.1 hypothetical protein CHINAEXTREME_07250 [Halobiforma lacisalsi AJ5]EMA37033.1 hypothetical protein C445_02296 [Halobiforma lacisalsi AJ5]
MRVSIPGVPGLYYDTDAGTTAIATVFSAAGRRAPKPQGYALQVLPYLWSFDVDLREVPNEHPIQYLHPEGARSPGELPSGVARDLGAGPAMAAGDLSPDYDHDTDHDHTHDSELAPESGPEPEPDRGHGPGRSAVGSAGAELESVLRFVWEVNREVESAASRMLGRSEDHDGVVVEIQEGSINVDGDELETDEFDVEDGDSPGGSDLDADPDSNADADRYDTGGER